MHRQVATDAAIGGEYRQHLQVGPVVLPLLAALQNLDFDAFTGLGLQINNGARIGIAQRAVQQLARAQTQGVFGREAAHAGKTFVDPGNAPLGVGKVNRIGGAPRHHGQALQFTGHCAGQLQGTLAPSHQQPQHHGQQHAQARAQQRATQVVARMKGRVESRGGVAAHIEHLIGQQHRPDHRIAARDRAQSVGRGRVRVARQDAVVNQRCCIQLRSVEQLEVDLSGVQQLVICRQFSQPQRRKGPATQRLHTLLFGDWHAALAVHRHQVQKVCRTGLQGVGAHQRGLARAHSRFGGRALHRIGAYISAQHICIDACGLQISDHQQVRMSA